MNIVKPQTFTTFQAAKIARVAPSTVIYWANKGLLKVTTTPGGHRRIAVSDLVDFMERCHMPVPENLRRPLRALVVDDDLAIAEMAAKVLKDLPGVETAFCQNAVTALFEVGKEPPDLLLMDVRMPRVDGLEVLRILGAGEWTAPIKVIAMSGEALSEAEEAFIGEHADGFIRKPFSPRELRALAAELLELEPEGAART